MSTLAIEQLQPPISCSECKLGRRTIYGPTLKAAPDTIYLRRREVRIIPAGRTFLREGEIPNSIFTIYSGWAYSFKQLPDGRRQIISFFIPGDTIVLESLAFPHFPMTFSVKSLTAVSACVFQVDDMVDLMSTTEAQKSELFATRQRYDDSIHERLLGIGRRSAVGRIAHLLLQIEERLRRRGLSENARFEFPPRQEHLADALGLTTVYVNRTLVALRKRGVITFDRHSMTILDAEELQRITEEE